MSHKRFLSIYDEYADDLLSYGYGLGFAKEDIEDTLQDVILNLYRNDPQLKDVRNVKVYLFTALKNRLMNTTRRQRMDSLDDGTGQFDVSVTVSDLVEDEEERRQLKLRVELGLAQLTPRQREAVYLHSGTGLRRHCAAAANDQALGEELGVERADGNAPPDGRQRFFIAFTDDISPASVSIKKRHS